MSRTDENAIITIRFNLSRMRCPECNALNRLTLVANDPLIMWCINCHSYHQLSTVYRKLTLIGGDCSE